MEVYDMIQIHAKDLMSLPLGRQGEHLARQVAFDLSDWMQSCGEGVAELIVRRPGDDRPYPVALEQQGSQAVWTLTAADTAVATSFDRCGQCELRWYVGEGLAKSHTWRTVVESAMDAPGETAPPAPEQGWVEQVVAAGAAAKGSAEEARAQADKTEALRGDAVRSIEAATDSCIAQLEAAAEEQTAGIRDRAEAAAQSAAQAGQSRDAAAHSAALARDWAQEAERSASRAYKRYIVRWNKTTAQMTRMGDAADLPTDTADFAHLGSVNERYSNPFDLLYPWSERRLCNIDIPTYLALGPGGALRDCVVAWEGDTVFSYDHPYGVWVYTPEFWGDSWDDGAYRYYEVCDREVGSKHRYPAQIGGRWHGRVVTLELENGQRTCLLPAPGLPGRRESLSTLHGYAGNYGATLDTIWSMDASTLLYLVEYANWDTQLKLGSGVSSLYRQNVGDKVLEAAQGNVVKVQASAGAAWCIPGAILDIGTSVGGNQVGTYEIIAVESEAEVLLLTLDRETVVTPDNTWSIHGKVNTPDPEIGSRSGYLGTNGKSISYYRGEAFFGNQWRYVLGAYHQANTNHLWLAHDVEEADSCDALDTGIHRDTGVVLSPVEGYIKGLAAMRANGLCAAPVCVEVGGGAGNPVGDYHYISVGTNSVLLAGSNAGSGAYCGRCADTWGAGAASQSWAFGAVPFLKHVE